MKKWFMSALLPLLLLAQQEVSATPLSPETLVSATPNGGYLDPSGLGYTAIFDNQDTNGDGEYDYTDISVLFGLRIDLTVARELIRDPLAHIPLSRVQPNTLMNFLTIDLTGNVPLLTLLALSATNPVTKNPSNVGNLQLGDANIGPMTAFYRAELDGNLGDRIPQPGQSTCIDLGTSGNGASACVPIELQAVPAPTSLMLLGIGLLALRVLQRGSKLS
ncbi:MAG: PEP-CTERM sorting domain-containing protein [Candidatus Competibacteraceae bacterium]